MNDIGKKGGKSFWAKLRRSSVIDLVKFALLVMAIFWLLRAGVEGLGYHWQWYRIPRYIFSFEAGRFTAGPLLDGLLVTFYISGLSLALSFAFGLIAALLRLSHSYVGRFVARAYLELIRNTPLLVQLFFIYFVLGPVLDIDRVVSAVLALSLFEGAYASEIFRAGILSVRQGQWEAAYSLGLSTFQTYRRIILPQALRYVLPPLTNQAISLIKDSALVSAIAVYDLTMQGQVIIAETFLTFEVWFTIAAIYLMITVTLSIMVNILENHLRIEA
ncbi:MAG: amino acid ABC transporter permease [Desulforhabdus sp.]|jgi:polar amino acid transport system permease protein|nr:amino acid ABC transporter permease [Desulforhabdus sp.]